MARGIDNLTEKQNAIGPVAQAWITIQASGVITNPFTAHIEPPIPLIQLVLYEKLPLCSAGGAHIVRNSTWIYGIRILDPAFHFLVITAEVVAVLRIAVGGVVH